MAASNPPLNSLRAYRCTRTGHRLECPKVCCHIDSVGFERKPTHEDAQAISPRVAAEPFGPHYLTDVARALAEGRTVCPADFAGNSRRLEDWRAQQLWFVDVDGHGADPLSERGAVARAEELGLPLVMAYQTFGGADGASSKGKGPEGAERFRLVFARRDVVTDRAEAERFASYLKEAFPECDPSTDQLNRMFYGTDKPVETFIRWGA